MAVTLLKVGRTPNVAYKKFICDTTADYESIDTAHTPVGSKALVLDQGPALYILSSEKEWVELPTSGGGGGSGSGSGATPAQIAQIQTNKNNIATLTTNYNSLNLRLLALEGEIEILGTMPTLQPGYVYLVDGDGNYLTDESGNYYYVKEEI